MIRVQFNDKNSMQQVEFHIITSCIVQLEGKNIPHSTAGFKAYLLNGGFLGDYSDFTEIVMTKGNLVQLKKPD